jgi:hypothetical protein
MATKDSFPPDARVPLFLSERAEKAEHPDIGRAWDMATISSRILKMSIVAVTATAIGIAILSIGNPVELVANVTDWWADKSALQPDADPSTSTTQADPSTPPIQSVAGTQDLPPTTTDAPTRDEVAVAVAPADQSQTEISQPRAEAQPLTEPQPVTEALFKQFQAWAAEEETRAQAGPAQPEQTAPVKMAQDAPAQVRPVKKHRRVQSVRNARAEIRAQRHHRARVREEQDARVAPVADPRAQDMQNAQPPSLLQSLGLRN